MVIEAVPDFVGNLSAVANAEKTDIADSTATIVAIVNILDTIADVTANGDVSGPVMEVSEKFPNSLFSILQ